MLHYYTLSFNHIVDLENLKNKTFNTEKEILEYM